MLLGCLSPGCVMLSDGDYAAACVQDILKVVRAVVDRADAQQHRVYNMGGLATHLYLQLGYML